MMLVAFLIFTTVGTCAELDVETKALIAKAERGGATAQILLGVKYATGEGVPQDYKEAVKWFRKGAEQGYADAQYNLGLTYYNGRGVLQDYKEAVKWFRKAAEQGYALAQSSLGFMNYNGEGVLKDYVKAYAWFNVASANGSDGGTKGRDLIAKEMTPEQIAEAQKLSREWFEKYQPKK